MNDHKWKSAEDVLSKLNEINANGGNLLLNIGPDGSGVVPQESVEILERVGNMIHEK